MGMKTKYIFLIVNHNITEIKTALLSRDGQTIDGIIYANYHCDCVIAKEKASPGWWKSALLNHRERTAEYASVLGERAQGHPAN